jgi:hypothetical protein
VEALFMKKLNLSIRLFLFAALFSISFADQPSIRDHFVLSDIDKKEIEVRFWISEDNASMFKDAGVDVTITYPDGSVKKKDGLSFPVPENGGFSFIKTGIDPVLPWHPSSPNLYRIYLTFHNRNGEILESIYQSFGMRKLDAKDAKFAVNNKPFYVRACGGEGGCGCDNLSREEIVKRLTQARNFGFNAIRHHTHIPTEEYMEAADEVGIFIQMEIGGKQIGNDPKSENFLSWKQKWIDMIKTARRHPSSFIYSVGNEIYLIDPGLIECLDILYDLAKEMDPSTFVLNRSGSNPFNDDYGKFDLIERPIGEYEHVAEFAREAFMLYLRGDRRGKTDKFPIIAHEYPLVASYPNPELTYKYKEEPEWMKTAVENARKNGLEHLLPLYVKNTEKIQAICRKEMLEEARKFPELDGYSMLRFVDCGSYVSGVVDDFSDPKNVTREEFLRTNGETALLCTWNNRGFYYGDTLEAALEISHHGQDAFTSPKCVWWLMNGPLVLARGAFEKISVNPVDVAGVGEIKIKIPELDAASKLTLRAVLPDTRPLINNEWSFWAFPKEKAESDIQKNIMLWDPRKRMKIFSDAYPSLNYSDDQNWKPGEKEDRLVITDSWQESFYDFLEKGGRLFLISDKSWPWPEEIGIFGLHITRIDPEQCAPPVFPELDEKLTNWLTICSNNPKRFGNSGAIIYPHPALRNFPNEGFCDLHFWPMIYRAKSLRLADFPPGTQPLIRTIDNYYRGDSKGYMAELRVDSGKVFICTLNLTQSFPRAIASQYMFDQLLRYVSGPEFDPEVKMASTELKDMIQKFALEMEAKPPEPLNEMGARYDTLWKERLFSRELIVLHPYDAKGADKKRIDIHYEYAQTKWFYNALPADVITWEFSNKKEEEFEGTIYLAGSVKGVKLLIGVDDREPMELEFRGTSNWQDFVPVSFQIHGLKPGKHSLKITVPDDAPQKEGRSVQIREVELGVKEIKR